MPKPCTACRPDARGQRRQALSASLSDQDFAPRCENVEISRVRLTGHEGPLGKLRGEFPHLPLHLLARGKGWDSGGVNLLILTDEPQVHEQLHCSATPAAPCGKTQEYKWFQPNPLRK